MATKICPCCGETFQPHHKVPTQTYCSSPACQQKRKQGWERDKQKNDPDYRDNKKRVQRAWVERNPDYWRRYRKSNPDSVSKVASSAGQGDPVDPAHAKTDELVGSQNIPAGVYRIRPVPSDGAANRDSWIVEITPVCLACPCQKDDCQDRT